MTCFVYEKYVLDGGRALDLVRLVTTPLNKSLLEREDLFLALLLGLRVSGTRAHCKKLHQMFNRIKQRKITRIKQGDLGRVVKEL